MKSSERLGDTWRRLLPGSSLLWGEGVISVYFSNPGLNTGDETDLLLCIYTVELMAKPLLKTKQKGEKKKKKIPFSVSSWNYTCRPWWKRAGDVVEKAQTQSSGLNGIEAHNTRANHPHRNQTAEWCRPDDDVSIGIKGRGLGCALGRSGQMAVIVSKACLPYWLKLLIMLNKCGFTVKLRHFWYGLLLWTLQSCCYP